MYRQISQNETSRTYKSTVTGTEFSTRLLFTGEDGKKWWGFDDLLSIPFIRKKAAEKVTQLYGAGLTKDDVSGFIGTLKTILKSEDPEKYERAYSELLQMEDISEETSDPVKQSLSLCSVYVLADDETVDTFNFTLATEKLNTWALQSDLQAFFLNWLTDGMNAYTRLLSSTMEIASKLAK